MNDEVPIPVRKYGNRSTAPDASDDGDDSDVGKGV
jgi:hypothetical protein